MYGIFARNLTRLRQEAGLKMYAAADALGVAKSSWSQWESGKRFPNGEMLAALAASLKIEPWELLKKPGCESDLTYNVHKMLTSNT